MAPDGRCHAGAAVNLYLACGMDRIEGYTHVDINPACKPDIIYDVLANKVWPWENVDDIQIKHFIEHIPHGDGKDMFIRFFENCWLALKHNGTINIRYPWYSSIGAYADPTHHRVITPLTFSYLSRAWLEDRKIQHYDIGCDFEVVQTSCEVSALVVSVPESERETAISTMWNGAHEGMATLRAIKTA